MMMRISKTWKWLKHTWADNKKLSAQAEAKQQDAFLRAKAQKQVTIEFGKSTAYIMVHNLPVIEIPSGESIEHLLLTKRRQEDILIDYWKTL